MPQNGSNPLAPWVPRQPLDHRRLNAFEEQAITTVTVGPGLVMARNGNALVISLAERTNPLPLQVYRMVITDSSPAGDDSYLKLAKPIDRAGTVGNEVPVQCVYHHEEGDHIYAVRPVGGVITSPSYEEEPVEYQEFPVERAVLDVRWNDTASAIQKTFKPSEGTPPDADWEDVVTAAECDEEDA